MPEDIPTVTLNPETHLEISELLVELGLSGSRSGAKRLVEQGGVYVNEALIEKTNEEIIPEDNMIIKAGKRSYVRIKVSDGK
jgi:tyrosyl-tRNA synthetase